MNKEKIVELNRRSKELDAEGILKLVFEEFSGEIALATSFGAEDQVLTDMVVKLNPNVQIFTLDTGRLPQETYDVMDYTQDKYGIKIDILFPDRLRVEEMVREKGPNLFYKSVENRKQCCFVRKVEPLQRKLKTLKAWITGLRQAQSVTRDGLEKIHWDEANGLVKVNPLCDWSEEKTWDYIKQNKVPYNQLHDAGYPSIGCAPCTRAVEKGADLRSGRWWWENPDSKECGLHR